MSLLIAVLDWGNPALNAFDWYFFRPAYWNITGDNATIGDLLVRAAGR